MFFRVGRIWAFNVIGLQKTTSTARADRNDSARYIFRLATLPLPFANRAF